MDILMSLGSIKTTKLLAFGFQSRERIRCKGVFEKIGSNNWMKLVLRGALKSNSLSSGENSTNSSNPSRKETET
jgi:hypothetical protein